MSNGESFAGEWLKKAGNDLITARQALLLEDGPTDTVCFHAQQAVEKALKGLLAFRGIHFQRTHSLVLLLDLAEEPGFEQIREQCAMLSAYAVEVRCPGDLQEPERRDALEAAAVAEQIVSLVNDCLTSKVPSR